MHVVPKNLSVPEDWNLMHSLATLVLKCQWSNASFYYTRDLRQAGASGQIKKNPCAFALKSNVKFLRISCDVIP
jgi:hypothetical protein